MIKSEITSDPTSLYNCVAWALEDQNVWLEPDPWQQYAWPVNIPRNKELDTFIQFFRNQGYESSGGEAYEKGFQKIALYVNQSGDVAHVARQLDGSNWTSKLGRSFDVSHPFVEKWDDRMYSESIEHITSSYGELAVILKKALP